MKPTPTAAWLERYTDWVMRHPLILLGAIALVMLALGSQLRHLEIDTDLEHFIHESHPARQAYNAVKETYGRNDVIVIGVSASDVLSQTNLTLLADLHRRIEQEVPWVRRINSLINAPTRKAPRTACWWMTWCRPRSGKSTVRALSGA